MEGESSREERKKYQRTAKVLTLFIVSYQAQWLSAVIYFLWVFVTPPPTIVVSDFLKFFLNVFSFVGRNIQMF